ncbi:MAG: GNAT family N-acetyltransferase [Hyphomicrobiales bacterium]
MATPSLDVRVLSPSEIDLAATVEVLNAAFRTYDFLGADRTSLEEIGHELAPESKVMQVFDNGRLIATATLTPAEIAQPEREKFPGIDYARSAYFAMAGVLPERMGEGLGRRLVAEAERLARVAGFERMILSTIEEMGNVAYYGKLGYESVSVRELPPGYWGLTITAHEHGMARALTPVCIRLAGPDDATTIADLVNLAYRVEDFFKVGDRTDAAEIAEIIDRGRFFVAEQEGRAVGCVYVTVAGNRGHFGMLSVHPETQGQGLARSLLETVERYCLEQGCEYLDMEYVNLREELPAFYGRFGFEETGTQPWPEDQLHRISRPAHFVTMTRRIAP